MADIVKNLFGGAKSAVSSAGGDDAFADFATAASPVAPSHAASSAFTAAQNTPVAASPVGGGFFGPPLGLQGRPFTKWYRVWERVTIHDFYLELVLIPVVVIIAFVHMLGSRANARRAKQWATTHVPILESEFAVVGFKGRRGGSGTGAADMANSLTSPEQALRQQEKNEYITYASGRANVAFVDIKLSLHKRYNPLIWLGEQALAFFIDSMPAPAERMEATAVCFDGNEKALLATSESVNNSTFDGFVWAIVHKDKMRTLRDDRYDLSLTATRDHPKLPDWATLMTESAEISDALLTPELIKAIEDIGEDLEALIISDQPIDAPKRLNDVVPKKRVTLWTKLNTQPSSTRLFEYFLRMPDLLVNTAHFRPEAMRKVRATREDEMRKIRKLDDDEKAEERRAAGDKMKKEERDRRLGRMTAEEQRKFLEKEKEVERKKLSKKRTMRG